MAINKLNKHEKTYSYTKIKISKHNIISINMPGDETETIVTSVSDNKNRSQQLGHITKMRTNINKWVKVTLINSSNMQVVCSRR